MKNKCVDCNKKISGFRMRCEECWTLGFAEDLGLNVDDMLDMVSTKEGIKKLAEIFTDKVNEVK